MKRRSRAAAARTSTRLLAGCAGWVAACCILLPAAYPARARDVAIANEGLRVGFRIDGGRCTLTEITDLQRPHNFLDPEAGTQVWRIDLVDTEGRPVVLADGGAEPIVQTNSAFSREHLSLTWTNAGRGGTACDVTVHVQLRDDPVRAELRIEARPGPRVGIAAVHFPAIANLRPIGDGADDRLAYPYGAGRRASDPAHSLETMRLHYSSHNCSLQMFALYDAAHGLYLATEDGAMHAKRYHLSHTNGAMTWALEQHPAVLNRPGEAYAQPYPTVVAPFAGDYLDAAKIYRRWALRQTWARRGPVHRRTDMGPMKDADLNVQGPRMIPRMEGVPTFAEYRFSTDDLRAQDKGFDLARTEAWFKGLRALGDVTVLHFLTHWTLDGFDVGYPRFEPAGRFREHNGVLARLGIRPMAYVNIRRACSDPAFDWWREHDGVRGAIVDASGTPVNAPLRNVPFAIMAPGGSMWQSWLREKCATLVRDHGLPGLYLDEAAAMGSFANFQALDGRPAGASGQAWNEDSRSLCRTIKAAGRTYNPDFFTAGEAVSEVYLDVIDGNLLFGYSRHLADAIPLFHAVYHDYTVCLGRTVGKWTDSYLESHYPAGERRGDTMTGEFVARFAQAAAWGDVIGSVRGDIMDYSPPAGVFLKKLVFLRHAFPDYLKWGELLDYRDGGFPGAEPVPVRMAAWSPGTLPSDIPVASVLASAWRSPARKAVGLFLVNVTASPRTVRLPLDAQRLGLAPGPLAVRVTDGAGTVRTLSASDTLTLDLPGETPVFCILER